MIEEQIRRIRKNGFSIYSLPKDYWDLLGAHALFNLINSYNFKTVLDVGSGAGLHAEILRKNGKAVTKVDFGSSVYFHETSGSEDTLLGDFNSMDISEKFDCVWASHVYEHQLDANSFLNRVINCTKGDGLICLVIPPPRKRLVGGHINLSTLSVLIYRLILAGVDCRNAKIFKNGYNRAIIVRNTKIEVLPHISFDSGDVGLLKEYFPFKVIEGKVYL